MALPPAPAYSQPVAEQQAAVPPAAASWTDLADLALAAPVVLVGNIRAVDRIGGRDATDVPPGQVRALIEMDLAAALKAPAVLPARAAWLWQGRAAQRNRPPFAKGQPLLLFGRVLEGGGRPEVQAMALISPHGQQPWSAEAEAAVRAVLAANLKPGGGARMVTAVSDAARVEGTVEGVSESQFFLATDVGRPMTLVVRRTPGRGPQVLMATGELVDRAGPIERQTLEWRALACGMPRQLPARLAGDAGLAADYAAALQAIGACGRLLTPP